MHQTQTEAHIHEDDLTIYVQGGLSSENIPALESHLSECALCRETFLQCVGLHLRLRFTGKRIDPIHQRSEPRFETTDEAILQELNPLSFERRRVKLLNVSQNGIGLSSPGPVLPGTIVQIRIGEAVELGEVRYCEGRNGEGYRVGIRLNPS